MRGRKGGGADEGRGFRGKGGDEAGSTIREEKKIVWKKRRDLGREGGRKGKPKNICD